MTPSIFATSKLNTTKEPPFFLLLLVHWRCVAGRAHLAALFAVIAGWVADAFGVCREFLEGQSVEAGWRRHVLVVAWAVVRLPSAPGQGQVRFLACWAEPKSMDAEEKPMRS
jgi:hypothetical protein